MLTDNFFTRKHKLMSTKFIITFSDNYIHDLSHERMMLLAQAVTAGKPRLT